MYQGRELGWTSVTDLQHLILFEWRPKLPDVHGAIAREAHVSMLASKPHPTFMGRLENTEPTGYAVFWSEPPELVVLVTEQASTGPNPQASVLFVLGYVVDGIVQHFRRVVMIKDLEAQTVEPRQTLQCANPEIAVARLDQGPDGVLRQTMLGGPLRHPVAVFLLSVDSD